MAVVKLMALHVKRVVIANPLQVRAIAHAKVKTDRIDAVVLAKLYAAGFLPEVWQPDEATGAPAPTGGPPRFHIQPSPTLGRPCALTSSSTA